MKLVIFGNGKYGVRVWNWALLRYKFIDFSSPYYECLKSNPYNHCMATREQAEEAIEYRKAKAEACKCEVVEDEKTSLIQKIKQFMFDII